MPSEPYLLPFSTFSDAGGTLVSTQDAAGLPFAVQRVFWVYPNGADTVRGGHAHRTTKEVLTVVQGSVVVHTQTARGKKAFELSDISQGLYIPPLCWIAVHPAADAILCCMTSTCFEESDYIREYQEFLKLLAK